MITQLIDAMRAGKELQNPATWKNRQNVVNLVAAILAVAAVGLKMAFGIEVAEDTIRDVAEIVAIILGIVNVYLTTATSKKVGL